MKKKWIALGVLEGILLIIFFIKAVSYQEVNIQIPQDDMRLYRTIDGEEVSEPSAYVDKSYEGGAFYIGPEIVTLDRGYYLVTVDYETNIERGCISTVTTPDFRDSSVRVDEVPIIKEKNQISYRIFIRDDGLKVNIENREWSSQQDGWLLIKGIGIRTYAGSQWYSFLTLLIGCVLLNTALYAGEKYRNKLASKQQRFVFIMLVFTILAACLAQGTGYLFDGHDLDFHLKRIEGLKEGLLQGDFPVKIHPLWLRDNGYAVGVFYGDLLLYIPALLRIIGFSIQSSYQFYGYYSALGICMTPPLKKEPVSSPEILSVYFPTAASPFS